MLNVEFGMTDSELNRVIPYSAFPISHSKQPDQDSNLDHLVRSET